MKKCLNKHRIVVYHPCEFQKKLVKNKMINIIDRNELLATSETRKWLGTENRVVVFFHGEEQSHIL